MLSVLNRTLGLVVSDSDPPSSSPPALDRLPDFRNPGVFARILVIVHLAFFLFAGLVGGGPGRYFQTLTELALVVEPAATLTIVLCYALNPWLARLRYGYGLAAVILCTAAVTAAVCGVLPGDTTQAAPYSILRIVLLAVLCALLLVEYLRLRSRALSPALVEARLQSLQARIRPHFLLSLIHI